MFVLRCTNKLLDKLERPKITQAEGTEDDWYANLFRLGRRQSVIFTHAVSLYSFIVPHIRKQDLMKTHQVFLLGLEFQLKRDGFPHEHNVELLERFLDMHIGKTVNRSTVGSMNDMMNCAKWLAQREGFNVEVDVAKINRIINRTPLKAIGYKFPIVCFSGLYGLPRSPE